MIWGDTYMMSTLGRGGGSRENQMLGGGGLASVLDFQFFFLLLKKIGFAL